MKRLNICIDIDGTMTDPYYFMPYFNKFFGKNLSSKDCTEIKLHDLYGVNREQMEVFYQLEGENLHRNAIILPKVKEVMDQLKENNNLYIVTARYKEMEYVTLEWLEKHQISGVEVHSLGSHYKVEKAKELQCDVFLEDNPINSMEIAESGIKVLLMDTNYNREVFHKNIVRVQNWMDINEHIQSMMKDKEGEHDRSTNS